jgi:hypothetical protein
MASEKFYLVIVSGGVEPEVIGDYPDSESRDQMALTVHAGNSAFDFDPDDDGIFALDVINGVPTMWSYSGGFFEDNEDDEEED